jgi:hypothetical protein
MFAVVVCHGPSDFRQPWQPLALNHLEQERFRELFLSEYRKRKRRGESIPIQEVARILEESLPVVHDGFDRGL